jgi:hypothetical protein
MEPSTKSVSLDLYPDWQSRVPVHVCTSRLPRAGRDFSITLQKIVDWPVCLKGLASQVVKQ